MYQGWGTPRAGSTLSEEKGREREDEMCKEKTRREGSNQDVK